MIRIIKPSSSFLLLLALLASPLSAQDTVAAALAAPAPPNDEIPFAPLPLHSRFSLGWPDDAMYEADIAVPVHLWSRTSRIEQLGEPAPAGAALRDCFGLNTASRVLTGTLSRGVTGTGCTATLLPHFTIRQLSGGSAPVRTPTFNPVLELNGFVLGLDRDRTDRGRLDARAMLSAFRWLGMGPRDTDVTGRLGAFHLRGAHYSNGQSGCLYTNQVSDPDDDSCDRVEGLPEELNTLDGSFSTHYFEAGTTVAPIAFDALGVERRFMSLGYTIRWHPPVGGGGMSAELARAYGRWELGANAMLRWRGLPLLKRGRVDSTLRAEGVCVPGRADEYDVCRGSVEFLGTLPSAYGLGVSLRYVGGWDPYNIAFGSTVRNHRDWRPIISFVVDPSRAVTITRAARAAETR
jgi:hypothetical protein